MKEEIHNINEIIIRYLDGSAELEEKRLLLRWLKQSDDNRDDFIATRDLWLSCNVAAGNELGDAADHVGDAVGDTLESGKDAWIMLWTTAERPQKAIPTAKENFGPACAGPFFRLLCVLCDETLAKLLVTLFLFSF